MVRISTRSPSVAALRRRRRPPRQPPSARCCSIRFSPASLTQWEASLLRRTRAVTPASGTFTVATTANFSTDLGVVYQSSGLPLKRVASAPTVGQYAVNVSTGVYTTNATDNTIPMYVSYANTSTTVGKVATLVNQAMGAAPVFSAVLSVPYGAGGTVLTYKFFQAVSTKLSLGFKNEDFTIPQFDMEFFADAAGNVFQSSFST
jgi:hypothetical protein